MPATNGQRVSLLLALAVGLLACGAGAGVTRTTLRGHVPDAVSRQAPVGRLASKTNLSLAIGVPLRNRAELDEFLRQLQDPQSTNYHQYLTPQQFTERFGPTEQQYQSVIEFARNSRLAVVGTFSNRMVLDVEGSVADIERAFQITLRVYHHPTEARDFFAPDSEPSVPANVPVADMWGLSDFALPRPLVHATDLSQNGSKVLSGSGPSGSYRGHDFRNAYAPGAANIGSGQTVAVVEFDGYCTNDITAYESQCGYTNVPVQNVLIDGVTNNPGYSGVQNAVLEVSLDIEVAIAMAPGLSKVLVYMGNNPYNVLNRIVSDNTAKQISCSWAFNAGPTYTNWGGTLDSQLQQMGVQGQSFFQASGDGDAYVGSVGLSTSSGPTPVDSIYVTSVGGTTLTMTNL